MPSFIAPYGGRVRVSFFLLLARYTWPFQWRSGNLFNRSGWRGRPHSLKTGDDGSSRSNRSNRRTFPCYTYPFLPDTGQRLVLLRPHLCIHILVELGHHFCKNKTLVKKKKKLKKSILTISHTDEINTYSFFLQCQDFVGRRRMGWDQDDRRQGSVDLPSHPNFQSSERTLWPSQHAPYTCSWA